MKIMESVLMLCVGFIIAPSLISGHTMHMGKSCATVEPMADFKIENFIGKWYVIQKTSTSSQCMVYNIQETQNRSEYLIQQVSENSVIGVVKNNIYKYRGVLKLDGHKEKSDMRVKFPMNIIGESSFIVFMTDYTKYAAIYTCQSIAFTHRHSASILSRSPTLDAAYIEKIRKRLSNMNINIYDLTEIKHDDCQATENDFTININEKTFEKEHMKTKLKEFGNTVSRGWNIAVNGAKDVYHKIANVDEKKDSYRNDRDRDVEKVEQHNVELEPEAEMF